MATTNIERDEEMQRKFGQSVIAFADNMRSASLSLKKHAEDAADNMRDTNAQEAIQLLQDLADGILTDLPGIEEFGARQIVLANYISEARNMRFGR